MTSESTKAINLDQQSNLTHRFIDSLAENGQCEDGSDGWSQITGNGLNVVKELPALC